MACCRGTIALSDEFFFVTFSMAAYKLVSPDLHYWILVSFGTVFVLFVRGPRCGDLDISTKDGVHGT